MRSQIVSGLITVFLVEMTMPMAIARNFSVTAQRDAVTALQSDGVIDGGTLASLRLNDGVNRAEALKIILRSQSTIASSLVRIAASMPPISLFPDVDQSAWYAPYIELGFSSRLITGFPDGNFRPQAGLTTEQAASMLARLFREDTQSAPFVSSLDLPNKQGQWYTGAISVLNAKNAVMPGSALQVGFVLTRGQFFDMVQRMRSAHSFLSVVSAPVPTVQQAQQPVQQAYVPSQTATQGSVQVIQDGDALRYASTKKFAISVPSIGITDLTVTHPENAFTQEGVLAALKDGVGHLFSYPGAGSKVMIYGHSSGYPWDLSKYTKIFRTINKLEIGARVYVTYDGKLFVYQVTQKATVLAKDRTIFEPDSKGEELILYTCWPPDSISHRLIVSAVPVETIALK